MGRNLLAAFHEESRRRLQCASFDGSISYCWQALDSNDNPINQYCWTYIDSCTRPAGNWKLKGAPGNTQVSACNGQCGRDQYGNLIDPSKLQFNGSGMAGLSTLWCNCVKYKGSSSTSISEAYCALRECDTSGDYLPSYYGEVEGSECTSWGRKYNWQYPLLCPQLFSNMCYESDNRCKAPGMLCNFGSGIEVRGGDIINSE